MEYFYKKMFSPVGELTLIAGIKGLSAVLWEDDDPDRIRIKTSVEHKDYPVLLETERQLTTYFEKKQTRFSLQLDFNGTAFQQKVWEALLTIPFGETRTYGQIARQIGSPDAVRAVGGAANKNPISIIVPCHRVIGHSGKLTGFAGGLENKSLLLHLEQSLTAPTLW